MTLPETSFTSPSMPPIFSPATASPSQPPRQFPLRVRVVTPKLSAKSLEIDSLELFGEIDLEAERKEKLTGKSLQLVLTKKDLKEEYWPRLTKDKRVNFVKTDFSLWVDEDEQNGVAVDDGFASTGAPPGAGMDMEAMMAQMGGMGGMGGAGGMGGMPGMGGMAGMGGMPGMGGMGGDGMDIEKLMAQMKAERANGAVGDSKSDDSTSSDGIPELDEPEQSTSAAAEPSPETASA